MEPIFSRDAQTVGWLKGDVVYDTTGCPRALLRGNSVVDFDGMYLGRFEHSYFRDANGDAVAFVRGASGKPIVPAPRVAATVPALWDIRIKPDVRVLPKEMPPTDFWSEREWESFLGIPLNAD